MKLHLTPAALSLTGFAACAVLSATLSISHSAADAAPVQYTGSSAQAGFLQALDEFRDGKRTAAYGHFAQLADAGDAESARMALMLLRHGPRLYNAGWGASQPQIDRWMKLARGPMEPLLAESGD